MLSHCIRGLDDRISHALVWVNKGEEKELSFAAYLFSRREIPQYSINEHHPQKLYKASTTKTQINLVPYCFWSGSVRQGDTEYFCSFGSK